MRFLLSRRLSTPVVSTHTFSLSTLIGAGAALATILAVGSLSAHAMAPKPPGSCTPAGENGIVTPSPARKVVLKPVGTMPFKLPNGTTVDLSADLNTILGTAVTGTQVYFPTDAAGGADPCGVSLEISAAVTVIQLNAFQAGITFGYTPGGANDVVSSVKGKLDVNVGNIQMDFSVRQCVAGSCTTQGATKASALTAGVGGSFTVDFSEATTTPAFVYNTEVANILREIMNDGMKRLIKETNPSLLAWRATVREVIPDQGVFIFDAGTQHLIAPNQAFTVYAVTPSNSQCDVIKAVADAHTTQVHPISSTATIDKTYDSRGVKDGDVVVIRQVKAQGKR